MAAYRITQFGSRVIVGTEEEAVLVCTSLRVARQAVADAELLETYPARQVFSRETKLPVAVGE
jgi:hypothetical protein